MDDNLDKLDEILSDDSISASDLYKMFEWAEDKEEIRPRIRKRLGQALKRDLEYIRGLDEIEELETLNLLEDNIGIAKDIGLDDIELGFLREYKGMVHPSVIAQLKAKLNKNKKVGELLPESKVVDYIKNNLQELDLGLLEFIEGETRTHLGMTDSTFRTSNGYVYVEAKDNELSEKEAKELRDEIHKYNRHAKAGVEKGTPWECIVVVPNSQATFTRIRYYFSIGDTKIIDAETGEQIDPSVPVSYKYFEEQDEKFIFHDWDIRDIKYQPMSRFIGTGKKDPGRRKRKVVIGKAFNVRTVEVEDERVAEIIGIKREEESAVPKPWRKITQEERLEALLPEYYEMGLLTIEDYIRVASDKDKFANLLDKYQSFIKNLKEYLNGLGISEEEIMDYDEKEAALASMMEFISPLETKIKGITKPGFDEVFEDIERTSNKIMNNRVAKASKEYHLKRLKELENAPDTELTKEEKRYHIISLIYEDFYICNRVNVNINSLRTYSRLMQIDSNIATDYHAFIRSLKDETIRGRAVIDTHPFSNSNSTVSTVDLKVDPDRLFLKRPLLSHEECNSMLNQKVLDMAESHPGAVRGYIMALGNKVVQNELVDAAFFGIETPIHNFILQLAEKEKEFVSSDENKAILEYIPRLENMKLRYSEVNIGTYLAPFARLVKKSPEFIEDPSRLNILLDNPHILLLAAMAEPGEKYLGFIIDNIDSLVCSNEKNIIFPYLLGIEKSKKAFFDLFKYLETGKTRKVQALLHIKPSDIHHGKKIAKYMGELDDKDLNSLDLNNDIYPQLKQIVNEREIRRKKAYEQIRKAGAKDTQQPAQQPERIKKSKETIPKPQPKPFSEDEFMVDVSDSIIDPKHRDKFERDGSDKLVNGFAKYIAESGLTNEQKISSRDALRTYMDGRPLNRLFYHQSKNMEYGKMETFFEVLTNYIDGGKALTTGHISDACRKSGIKR